MTALSICSVLAYLSTGRHRNIYSKCIIPIWNIVLIKCQKTTDPCGRTIFASNHILQKQKAMFFETSWIILAHGGGRGEGSNWMMDRFQI